MDQPMTGPVIPIASESSGSNFNFRLHPPSILTSLSTTRGSIPPVVNCPHNVALLRFQHPAAHRRSAAAPHHPRRRHLLPAAEGSCRCEVSPFASANEAGSTLKIPDFSKYKSKNSPRSNQVFSYFMAGSLGLATAVGAKATVQDFLVNMSASADVLAQAKVEIALGAIPEGKNVIIKWRGKPVFIRHRTQAEIQEARESKWEGLRDPQPDEDRVQRPEWLVMLGVCTHLGCVPIGEAGDYGGWFCPCHGSHYDISGRIRKGPAPLNLEVPAYSFPEEETLVIG
ncbi:Ubiquinol-cytochrome c reductase iron-sulfur subunit [Penicillium fimorum]|uniref:Cytochrome b-c1 complex subunit Rieske, mitochondrial n=1 Tax=Penicillium fimorum TaxID=1882269 RepID=A0A9X0C3F3_9EURO|nr:Ubiquinol-cytochrome c reductase iron-sulfur subunit [Penicillium fimorum]